MALHLTVDNWIAQALTDTDKVKPDGKRALPTKLILVHLMQGGPQEVHTAILEGRQIAPTDLATMLRNKAEAYCQEMPGRQTFQLQMLYQGSNEIQARHAFTCAGKIEYEGMTEAPTPQGAQAQFMRQWEGLFGLMFRRQQTLDSHAIAVQEHQSRRIMTLEEQNLQLTEKMQELMVEMLDREHNQEMRRLEYARKTMEMDKLYSMGMPLANTIFGREIFPQSSTDTALIEAFADGMTAEKVQKLIAANVIPQELLGPLMHRLKMHEEKKHEKEKRMKELNPPVADPELDAAGLPQKTH